MKDYTIMMDGSVYEVTIEEGASTGTAPVARAAAPVPKAAPTTAPKTAPAEAAGSVMVLAPVPSKVLGVKAAVGQAVKKDDVVIALEAIKIENEVVAPSDGAMASVNVSAGDSVEAGATLVTLNQDNAL